MIGGLYVSHATRNTMQSFGGMVGFQGSSTDGKKTAPSKGGRFLLFLVRLRRIKHNVFD